MSRTALSIPPADPPRFQALLLANGISMASIYAFVALASPIAYLLSLQAWHIGMLIGMAGLVWVLLSAWWGRLADARGRGPALRLALTGFSLSYAVLAAYIAWALSRGAQAVPQVLLTLGVMLLTRSIMGGFYAGIPVATMAWVADHTVPDARAAVMARLSASGAIGMVLSPPLAGWLGRFDLGLSLGLFALLPLLALPLLALLPEAPRTSATPHQARLHIMDARIRQAWLSMLTLYGSVIVANICLGFFLIDRLGITPQNAAAWVGAALGCAGLSLIAAQAAVARYRSVSPGQWLRWGTLLGAAGFAATLTAPHPLFICAGYVVSGLGLGAAFPAVSALAANAVQAHEQGACAGAISSAQGMSMVVAPILGTLLYDWHPSAPFAAIGILLALVCVAT